MSLTQEQFDHLCETKDSIEDILGVANGIIVSAGFPLTGETMQDIDAAIDDFEQEAARKEKISPETKKIIADGDWWKEAGVKLGWYLHGFTFRQTATFFTENPKENRNAQMITVTKSQIDNLVRRIEGTA